MSVYREKVDHEKVSTLINDMLDSINRNININSVKDAIYAAWDRINDQRLIGDCTINLAAAEHYLYCRSATSRQGLWVVPILKSLSSMYDLSKLLGLEHREGPCPQSPSSEEDEAWRVRGARDGLDDFFGITTLRHLTAPRRPDAERILYR